MTVTLNQLLQQPNLSLLVKQAQTVLQSEAERREAFYEWMDDNMKVEFINGQIIMHSPVTRKHNLVRRFLSVLIDMFNSLSELGELHDEKAMIHLTRNSFEPDVCFFLNETAKNFQEEQMLFPAPDFVVEVLSKGSITRDRVDKLKDYAAHNIAEYWIIDPRKETIEQCLMPVPHEQKYASRRTFKIDETIESTVLKGFKIPVRALFDAKLKSETIREFSKK